MPVDSRTFRTTSAHLGAESFFGAPRASGKGGKRGKMSSVRRRTSRAAWGALGCPLLLCIFSAVQPSACAMGESLDGEPGRGAGGEGGSRASDAAATPDAVRDAIARHDTSAPLEASAGGGDSGPADDGASSTDDVSSSLADASDASEASVAPAFDRDAVTAIMKKVGLWQLDAFDGSGGNDWSESTFYAGVVAAYRATHDTVYLDAAKKWGVDHKWAIHGNEPMSKSAEDECCYQAYADLYLVDPSPASAPMIDKAKATFDGLLKDTHTGRELWLHCDALFMAPPAIARVGGAIGNPKYFEFIHKDWWDVTEYLLSPDKGLVWREGKYRNTDTFWAQGNGWVIAGAARVLDYLPSNDVRRVDYENLLRTMAAAIAKVQGTDGLWRASLLHPENPANPETSGTALFTYGIAWGIRHGVLDRATYLPIVRKAWDGLVSSVNPAGKLGYVQAMGEKPAAAGKDESHPYGPGGFLLAGSEVLAL
jgi:unsaturated rhamnogalacturonyl hydrolase